MQHVSKSSAPPRDGFQTFWDTESEADLAAARFAASQNPSQQPPDYNGDAVGATAVPGAYANGPGTNLNWLFWSLSKLTALPVPMHR